MPDRSNSPNHFLASLSSEDYGLIQPHLRPVELHGGLVLYTAQGAIERVYFPHTGVISLVVGLSDGRFVEAGMFGRNGVIGGGAALDGRMAINQAVAQVAGSGVTIEMGLLSRFVSQSDTLRLALMTHEQMIYAHTQQIAACNATHHVDERLCRWLMQTRDLLMSDTLPLTQEFLSQMLGVQRSSVTMVARKLQESGLINYSRGRIHVRDVEALRDSCCECYRATTIISSGSSAGDQAPTMDPPAMRTTDRVGDPFAVRTHARAAAPVAESIVVHRGVSVRSPTVGPACQEECPQRSEFPTHRHANRATLQ